MHSLPQVIIHNATHFLVINVAYLTKAKGDNSYKQRQLKYEQISKLKVINVSCPNIYYTIYAKFPCTKTAHANFNHPTRFLQHYHTLEQRR